MSKVYVSVLLANLEVTQAISLGLGPDNALIQSRKGDKAILDGAAELDRYHAKVLGDEELVWADLDWVDSEWQGPDLSAEGALDAVAQTFGRSQELVREMLTAIRLVKDTRIWVPYMYVRWDHDRVFGLDHMPDVRPDLWGTLDWPADRCRLGPKDTQRVQWLHERLSSALPPRIRLALRRFNAALDRPSAYEDGIVDLCVALEAAIATDANVSNRGDYLEKKAATIMKTRRGSLDMQSIAHHYWVRNQIVHATGKPVDAGLTFSALARDVRRILFEMISRPELIPLLSEGGSSKN